MRKTLFIVVLATCLLFAFSGVAMAKYAGYGYNIDGTNHVGYLSWDGAVFANPAQAAESPHGGYTANTVKCAVCHSAHRAATDRTTAGVGADWKLTPGGNSCIACHTATGSNPTAKLVEWPSDYEEGGPHRTFDCMFQCHAGVHGAVASKYGSAAKFLLNPNIRTTDVYARGVIRPAPTAGLGLDDGLDKAIAAGNLGGTVSAATLQTWPVGPAAAAQQAGTRAMVTGYLCSQGGCHTASQFAVNTPGYAEERTLPGNFTNGPYNQIFTGHLTSGNTTHCASSGCHSFASDSSDSVCAKCHDFKGVVTGTSAWPHANRSIDVYEWVRSEAGTLTVEPKAVVANNLWMYTGDVTYRDANGVPTSTPMWDGKTGPGISHGGSVEGIPVGRINTRKVLQGNAAFSATNGVGIRDGVCLKCHGFKYWPVHGVNSFGNPASSSFDRNFANY
jgi:hypothetical protein